MQKCSKTNGGLDFANYIDMSQSYGILLSEYNIVKAWLIKLWFQVDNETISKLEERGYAIVDSKEHPKYDPELYIKKQLPKYENLSINYSESIMNGLRRSEHLVTKIKMKANEMKTFINGSEGGRKEMLFDEIAANLMVRGIKVDDGITLSRYMELLKVLNRPTKEENVYG